MKKYFLLIFICGINFKIFSQLNPLFWKEIKESKIKLVGKREIIPLSYKTFHLDMPLLKQLLLNAPTDKHVVISNSTIVLTLPMPNGKIHQFKVVESPVMEDVLQASYPNIKTYSIKGITDQYANGKIDLTEFGFHAMIRSLNGDVFIDPYCQKNIGDYITYYSNDFEKPMDQRGECIGVLEKKNTSANKLSASQSLICAGTNLRTYRLAIACTGEYAKAATGLPDPTVAQTLAKVVTSVNRVDGVFETEVAIRLVLISTTTLVLFTVPGTGFTTTENSNANSLIIKSQSIITSSVGVSNFDIGHTFCTGGGGLAIASSVCGSSDKASGITGSSSPVGDPFDIDFIAHEIGHQFGANHTFRASVGGCAGNGNLATAVEPGSGISIMAYAGLCSGQNYGTHSIPYFHAISFDEIMNFTNSGGGSACNVLTSSGNNAPVVTTSSSFTIPINTPFILNGTATDLDGDALTYQWEELDLPTNFGNWNAGTKPFFRSYVPSISPSRMFPILSSVLSGNLQGTMGEYTPTTAQVLNFRLTVRDNKIGGGGVCSASTQVTVNSSGSFAVTSQSVAGLIYSINAPCLINWSVNGTNLSPINCSNVNIYISDDAGATFTLVLANTPNDGSELITLPNLSVTTSICRVKVESVGNIFFDINDKDFTISTILGLGINDYDASNSNGIQFYPNPFFNSVRIDIMNHTFLEAAKTVINIYDVLGNIVRTEPITLVENFSQSYDLSNLSNAIYIVELTDGKRRSYARLIKI
ncbi:MAG: reprolysin-like metallopeptidase [Bacteroidota bacterium]